MHTIDTVAEPYLQPHPLAQLFPEPEPDDTAALERSLKDHGAFETDPIVLLDGRVLDGVNRYHAARALGLKVPAVRWEDLPMAKTMTPLDFVMSRNLARRHLTPEQKAAVVLKAYEPAIAAMRAEAAERQRAGAPDPLPSHDGKVPRHERTSAAKVARIAGVSESTVGRVERAERAEPGSLARIAKGETTAGKVLMLRPKAERPERIGRDVLRFIEHAFVGDATLSDAVARTREEFAGEDVDAEAVIAVFVVGVATDSKVNVTDALIASATPEGRALGDLTMRDVERG